MGKADILSRRYLNRNDVFSDAVNLLEHDGKAVIKPFMLHGMNTSEEQVIITGKGGGKPKNDSYVQRFRDTVKGVFREGRQSGAYAILGMEEQTEVHYAAPVKLMLYDAVNYSNQINAIASQHKMQGERLTSAGEFLSGIRKSDRLIPVKTMVVFFNSEPWSGPRTLHDMLDMEGMTEKERASFPNYSISIIEPAQIPDEKLELLKSDLKLVLGFIKHSKDKEKLKKYLDEHEGFRHMDKETVLLVNEVCSTNIKVKEEEKGVIDVCKAIEDMKEDAREFGREEGGILKLISLVCRKIAKGKTPKEISEDLEEDYTFVVQICEAAKSCAPKYDCEEIYRRML